MKTAIVVTAGHSDKDPGAVGQGTTEAAVALEFRNLVAERLAARGVEVITDGAGAVNLPLGDAMALVARGVVAVEFHCNAAAAEQATGVESISLPAQKELCQQLSAAVAGALGLRVRGNAGWIDQSQSHRGRLGYVQAGGIICELFFLSNARDYAAYQANKDACADAVANLLAEQLV